MKTRKLKRYMKQLAQTLDLHQRQLRRDEAVRYAYSNEGLSLTPVESTCIALNQDRLLMPFEVMHRNFEIALDRPVWTHEFADREKLAIELQQRLQGWQWCTPPSMEYVCHNIPKEKLVFITL